MIRITQYGDQQKKNEAATAAGIADHTIYSQQQAELLIVSFIELNINVEVQLHGHTLSACLHGLTVWMDFFKFPVNKNQLAYNY